MSGDRDAPTQDFSRRTGVHRARNGYQRPSPMRRALALDLPIAWRLTLGFLLAAALASLAAGFVGVQRAQSLSRESRFYQTLLRNNTQLNAGDSSLQLMRLETQLIIDQLTAPTPSIENLNNEEAAIPRLEASFTSTLRAYEQHDLLSADQIALLNEGGYTGQATEQNALVSSVSRTWRACQTAQDSVLNLIKKGQLALAETTYRLQAQPTNSDTQSALRGLILFNDNLAGGVRAAATVEDSNETTITIIVAVVAFFAVSIVGWVISETLVRRLRRLRQMTQAVEGGLLDSRITVVGHDEIADVSDSVNGMLDTIVGLLDETRRQRDALTNAAYRLFSDMRVASAGDLRVNAAVSSDPIGLLGSAFNLTIGRFRRFALRTHSLTQQIDLLTSQQIERANSFLVTMQRLAQTQNTIEGWERTTAMSSPLSPPSFSSPTPGGSAASQPRRPGRDSNRDRHRVDQTISDTLALVSHARNMLSEASQAGMSQAAQQTLDYAEQVYLSAGRLGQLIRLLPGTRSVDVMEAIALALTQEAETLEGTVTRLGMAAFELKKADRTPLYTVDNTLGQVEDALQRAPLDTLDTPAPREQSGSHPSAKTQPDTRLYDFVRLAVGFAHEVNGFASRLRRLTQETRASIAPFQLEADEALASLAQDTPYDEYAFFQKPDRPW